MADQNNAFFRGLRFIRMHCGFMAVLSALVIIPCIWHRRIEAGDLPSHVYNAWLAQLIEQGKAPGLYTVWQWSNVLFDLLLLSSAKLLGFVMGPVIVVSICALEFFWGVFAFVAVASGRPPWFLTPFIAMLTYGYTFNMGFFNYYLSIGLACLGLAFLWKARGWDWLAGTLVFALVVLAHPIGSLWFLGTLTYVLVRRRCDGPWGLTIPATVVGIFAAIHWYLAHIAKFDINWPDQPFYLFNGADQLVTYSIRYRFIACASTAIFVIWFVYECVRWREYSSSWKPFVFLVELYLVSFCVTSLLPEDLLTGFYSAWIGLLVFRLTVISAVFGLCAVSCLSPRKWVLIAMAGCAAVFFAFLYVDTAVINRLELHAEELTTSFPYGTRVIPTLGPPPDSRICFIGHVIDRACIGHCFTYSNYEAPSGQFRVRVRPGSPLVTPSPGDAQKMEAGTYVVQMTDLPLKEIYQCIPDDFTVLCMRNLALGDTTGVPEDDSENER
jgi:hypothetical protein